MPRASIDRAGQPTAVETFGRHDPCVGIRATPIAEAHAGAGGDGPCAAPPRAVRRRGAAPLPPIAGAAAPRAEPRRPRASAPRPSARSGSATSPSIGLFNPYAPLWFQQPGLLHAGHRRARLAAELDARGRALRLGLAGRPRRPARARCCAGRRCSARWSRGRLAGSCAMPAPGRWRWWWRRCSWPTAASCRSARRAAGAPARRRRAGRAALRPRARVGLDRLHRRRCWPSAFVLQCAGIGAFPLLRRRAVRAAAAGRVAPAAPRASAAHAAASARRRWPVLRQPEVRWFFAGVFFTVLAHTSLYAFFSLYLDALGYGKARGRRCCGRVSVAVEIVFFWLPGPLVRALGAHRWLLLAALVSAAALCRDGRLRRRACGAGAGAAARMPSPSRPSTRPASA